MTDRHRNVLAATFNTVLGILLLLGLYLTSRYEYVLFHSLAEVFSIVTACGVFVLAWNSRHLARNNYLVFLGVAYLFMAAIDLLHMLAYEGVGVFRVTGSNLATQLWIAGRYVQCLSLVAAPFFLRRRLNPWAAVLGYALAVALVLASILHWNIFPTCFNDAARQLTEFKKVSEHIISALLLVSILLLWRRRDAFDRFVLAWVTGSIALTVASELCFTLYHHPYDPANLAGHMLRIVAFWCLYRAIIETGLRRPYDLLFRELKQSEEALRRARDELEQRVRERTAELVRSNERLQLEVHDRTRAEAQVRSIANLPAENLNPVLRIGSDGCVQYANAAAQPLLAIWKCQVGKPLPSPARDMALAALASGNRAVVEVTGLNRVFSITFVPIVGMAYTNIYGEDITESKRAAERIQEYQRQLRLLASELSLAEERERRRLAQALHDNLGQILAVAKIKLSAAAADPPDKLRLALREAENLVQESIRFTRSLTFDLSSPVLYDLGLEAAVESLAEDVQTRHGIRVRFVDDGRPKPLSEDLRVLLYNCVRELLVNVVKHASAHEATVHIRRNDDALQIDVEDDGAGFDVPNVWDRTRKGAGLGLFSIRERLGHVGGRFTLHSAPGKGTRATMSVPLQPGPETEPTR